MATATANKAQAEVDTDEVSSKFQVLDEAPEFVKGSGRGKSELRTAIEELPNGKFLNTGMKGEKAKANVRGMTTAIKSLDKEAHEEDPTVAIRTYSVREAAGTGFIIVGRQDETV